MEMAIGQWTWTCPYLIGMAQGARGGNGDRQIIYARFQSKVRTMGTQLIVVIALVSIALSYPNNGTRE